MNSAIAKIIRAPSFALTSVSHVKTRKKIVGTRENCVVPPLIYFAYKKLLSRGTTGAVAFGIPQTAVGCWLIFCSACAERLVPSTLGLTSPFSITPGIQ